MAQTHHESSSRDRQVSTGHPESNSCQLGADPSRLRRAAPHTAPGALGREAHVAKGVTEEEGTQEQGEAVLRNSQHAGIRE